MYVSSIHLYPLSYCILSLGTLMPCYTYTNRNVKMGHITFYLSFCWTKISNRLTEMKTWITLLYLSGQRSNGLTEVKTLD